MKKLLYAWGLFFALLSFTLLFSASAYASTNDFTIKSFDSKYELKRGDGNRSVLSTTETITAVFSDLDKNHGLERAIPNMYDGHTVELSIKSITNERGEDLQYTTHKSGDTTLVRIGDPDKYVHGENTYRITYAQQDVTKHYADTGKDEWYWDLNGTQWRVPIKNFSATIVMDESLRTELRREPKCYMGVQGSSETCEVTEAEGGVYSLTASDIGMGSGVTVAFGFNPDTFGQYEPSPLSRVAQALAVIKMIAYTVSIPAILLMSYMYRRKYNRLSETKQFATEFIPPKNTSVSAAANVVTPKGQVFAAQLIDLAVRHYISIVETRAKKFFKTARYDIVIKKDISTLLSEEREILSDMFGHEPKVDERIAMHELKNNVSYTIRLGDNGGKLDKLIQGEYSLREKSPDASKLFKNFAVIFTILSLLTFAWLAIVAAVMAWYFYKSLRPLTDKGVELRRYVLGLERYVSSTEKDRLAFLQGPETAEKVGYAVNTDSPGQLIKLYERTLPYAVLFGQEKEWGKRLGEYYQQSGGEPNWYASQGAFNAALFASSLSSFNIASAASSYSGSSSSSSVGGSGGGGFSGGGGGGGGGGGW